jgi:hypothetical protein
MMKMNGKGDKRRPQEISDEEMKERWDAIFKQKPNEEMFDENDLSSKDKEKEETKTEEN